MQDKNLGDDLFIKMLLDKYPNEQFVINFVEDKYKEILKGYNNVQIINGKSENFENIDINSYDGFIYIGGSIFMEGGKVYNLDEGCNQFMKKCKEQNKPFFYVSSNFGPYQTEEYFKLCKDTFKNCTDLCFRDIYSYDLFKDISSIRYAPDLVFDYEFEPINTKKNTIGITIIDLSIRKEKDKKEQYLKMMANNIMYYIDKGKEVYLFSYCEPEGDMKAINDITAILPNKYKDMVKVVSYDGNMDKFMEIYSSMEYNICLKFHAMILSYVFKQKFYVISYSKKIDNVIEELKLCNKENYCSLGDIKEDMIIKEDMFCEVNIENLNKIKEASKGQLLKVEEWINK